MNSSEDGLRSLQIEEWVRLRHLTKALPVIKRWLKHSSHDPEKISQGCDWLRRLGHYRTGLRIILNKETMASEPELKRVYTVWAARFLHLAGASTYALQLLKTIQPRTLFEHTVFAGVFMGIYRFEDALGYLRGRLRWVRDRTAYEERIYRISEADCLAASGRFESAVALTRNVLAETGEPYLKAICWQALGEYHAKTGQFETAREYFNKARPNFKSGDYTFDSGTFEKWMGYTLAELGDMRAARRHFKRSTDIFKKIGHRDEVWLENYRLGAQSDLVDLEDQFRLAFYPKSAPEFWQGDRPVASHWEVPGQKIFVDLGSREYRRDGQWHPSLSLEMKLLAYLRIAGDWGLGMEVAKTALWPREVYSYNNLEDRLFKLTRRLRLQFAMEVSIKAHRLYLTRRSFRDVGFHIGDSRRPDFLRRRQRCGPIKSSELCRHYAIGRTQAVKILKAWSEAGWIRR